MNESTAQRLVPRAGMICLALLMILTSAGFAYVAHLTQATSQRLGDAGPSLLPLIALSVLSAIGGLAMFRFAWNADIEAV